MRFVDENGLRFKRPRFEYSYWYDFGQLSKSGSEHLRISVCKNSWNEISNNIMSKVFGDEQTYSGRGEKKSVFSRSWVIPVNWNLLPRQLQDEHLLLALLVDKRLPGIGCDSFIRFTFWWDCAESFSLVQWFFLANTVIKQVLLLPSAETNQFKIPLGNSLFPLYRPGSRQVSLSGWNQAEILRGPCHKAPFTVSWLKNINVQPTYLVCYLKKDSLISWLINSFIALFIFSKNILNRFS